VHPIPTRLPQGAGSIAEGVGTINPTARLEHASVAAARGVDPDDERPAIEEGRRPTATGGSDPTGGGW
jgi:NADH-quinone oxidoreductase subunit J